MESFYKKYCIDLNNYERFPSRIVKVGDFSVGGLNPIRIQSMTNIALRNIDASVNQCIQLFDAGADFVRLSVPRIVDVENLKRVKEILKEKGYKKPLIADVHFNPHIAEETAKIVEKVRINPGNYIDNKHITTSISDYEYELELEKTHEKLLPLIKICKQYGTAIRIGSNHGSLSNRILAKYGDTIEGMVEAVLEFLEIFLYEKFYNVIVSMKASNINTMIYASRLLNAKMIENSTVFPQHIGVTEAGEGIDGRLKSALGIGALLTDGIGDTIRVSLSENPVNEVIFAKKIVSKFSNKTFKFQNISQYINTYNPFIKLDKYPKNPLFEKKFIIISNDLNSEADLYYFKSNIEKISPDKNYLTDHKIWKTNNNYKNIFPLLKFSDTLALKIQNDINYFVIFEKEDIHKKEALDLFKSSNIYPIINCDIDGVLGNLRYFYSKIGKTNLIPLIIKNTIINLNKEDIITEISDFPGTALVDNLCSGIWMDIKHCNTEERNTITKELLQSTEIRRYRAEFISCPTCGRTSYDLEKLAKAVKLEFNHLNKLKIAVMGCIVNGPGEMNDADYGCIGTAKGMVNIYKGKNAIYNNVPENEAVKKLKELILNNNDWYDK